MPSTASIQDTHPTVNIDGADNAALTQGLLELMVIEDVAGLYRCEATFGNLDTLNGGVDYPYFDRRTLDFGKPFRIKINGDVVVFNGRIMALEAVFPQQASPSITVLAEDRFQDLRMTRRTRTFTDKSDRDIISSIARDHGLTPQIDINSQQHGVIAQVNQSDLAFLREMARAIDAEIWVDDRTLHAKSRSLRGGNPVELRYTENLYEFIVTADLANQRTSVTVSGWDTSAKSSIKHEANEQIIRSELNGDDSGVSILQNKLGARKEMLAHTVPLTTQEAQIEAETYFKMNARRFVVGRGSAAGDGRLRVGTAVRLSNVGPLFNGKYILTEVRHVFHGAEGLRTEFTAERPGLGRPR